MLPCHLRAFPSLPITTASLASNSPFRGLLASGFKLTSEVTSPPVPLRELAAPLQFDDSSEVRALPPTYDL